MFNRWRSPRTLIGVDVGSRSIKVVQAVRDPQAEHGIRVAAAAEVPTPEGVFDTGHVGDVAALGAAIKLALKEAGVRGRTAALAVPPQVGFLRKLAFPKVELKELRSIIELQPERYIPFARDGVVFDVRIVDHEAPEGQMWAMLAAAPRQVVADLMAAARAAGLRPVRVDLEQLALHRAAVAVGAAGRDRGTALVDLSPAVAKISLFEGEVPLISRVLDMPRPAEGTAGYPMGGIETEDLFLDIRRSLEFALAQGHTPTDRVLLGGGLGGDAYLALSLTAYLRGFLANRLPPQFEVLPLEAPALNLPGARMVALGLSLLPEWIG